MGSSIDPARLVKDKRSGDIRQMFNAIAHRYDLANHVLSIGIDRLWRRRTRRELSRILGVARPRILDVCCGTGDLSRELSLLGPVMGVDFAHDMLIRGHRKIATDPAVQGVHFVEGDGLALPVRDGTFDAVTAAFGVRNFEDLQAGLREMASKLRVDGVLAILEFSKPDWPVFSAAFRLYFKRILPLLGGFITGHRGAYTYLPASVESFIEPGLMMDELRSLGMRDIHAIKLTGGIARLYLARK